MVRVALLAFLSLLVLSAPATAQAETVVEIDSRGQKIRALLIGPA